MPKNEYDILIDRFSKGTISEKHQALRKLIVLRKHNMASKEVLFTKGVEQIIKIASDSSSNDWDRLISISLLSRISSSIRRLKTEYSKYIIFALKNELPDLQILTDVDDKTYVGKACSLACYEWIEIYASNVVIFEETGEQVRLAFSLALIKSTKSLDQALMLLKDQMSNFSPTTEEPGNTIAKRLRRILITLRNAMAETYPEVGEETGQLLYDFISETFSDVQKPTDKEALAYLSEEVAATIHDIIRLRFSLATTSKTYKSLLSIKKIFDSNAWVKFTNKSQAMNHVAQDILESILILAKQEIPDNDLVNCLKIALGNKDKAQKKLMELSKNPGLSPRIKNWLFSGVFEVPKNMEKSFGESEMMIENRFVSDLLVDAQRYRKLEEIGRKTILTDTEILNPSLANDIKKLLNYGLGLCDSIDSLAKRRSLHTRGTVGNEVDYSPIDHELIIPSTNIRKVRIIRPTVDQVDENGISFVIRKGLVEPIQ